MSIDCAEFCCRCGSFHLATFDCGVEPEVVEEAVTEEGVTEVAEDKVEETVAVDLVHLESTPDLGLVETVEVSEDEAIKVEAQEAVEAVQAAVSDGEVTKSEVGAVLGELSDVKPRRKYKKRS